MAPDTHCQTHTHSKDGIAVLSSNHRHDISKVGIPPQLRAHGEEPAHAASSTGYITHYDQ